MLLDFSDRQVAPVRRQAEVDVSAARRGPHAEAPAVARPSTRFKKEVDAFIAYASAPLTEAENAP